MINLDLNPPKPIRARIDRGMAVVAIISIMVAWVVGGWINRREPPDCRVVLHAATACRPIRSGIQEGVRVRSDSTEEIIGWANNSEAPGYAGPIEVMVGVNPAGEIMRAVTVHHTETPGFYARIEEAELLEELAGKAANAPFMLDEDIDAVTNATVSSRAIVDAAREASYAIAEIELGLRLSREEVPLQFGLLEISIIALFAIGYVAHRPGFKYKKAFRWGTMIAGMIILGFMFNVPITIAHFNSLLLVQFPDWRTNLSWFLLMGGFLFVVTVDKKNPYCSWFCPFGAAQECLGALGNAKLLNPGRYRYVFTWVQRGLAWSAVVLALLLRNPGLTSYEIFGTLFALNPGTVLWIILGIILVLSLFVRRPWCNYLCPLDPAVDLIQAGQRWIGQTRKQWRKQAPAVD